MGREGGGCSLCDVGTEGERRRGMGSVFVFGFRVRGILEWIKDGL